MNRLFACILLCGILATNASGLTLTSDRTDVPKGQTVTITGECMEALTLTATANIGTLLTKTIACKDNRYLDALTIPFLFPSGSLQLTATEKEQAGLELNIVPSRESQYLTITSITPLENGFDRETTLELQIRLLDGPNPVENATVQAWDFNGNKIALHATDENGEYARELTIPYNTPLENYDLVVVAQNADQTAGGEQIFSIPIRPAKIQIDLQEPPVTTLNSLEQIPFKAQIVYSNQQPLQNPSVRLEIDGQTLAMNQNPEDPTTYETAYTPPESQIGNQTLRIHATDGGQNEGTLEIQVFIAKSAATGYRQYIPHALLTAIVLILAWLVVIPRIKTKKKFVGLEKRQAEIEQKIAELQTNYFDTNSISKQAYDAKNKELQKELAETSKKIKTEKP